MSLRSFDAAVIGSGPNGLAAALAAQSTGRRVVVYEAADVPGGGMRTESLTLSGFRHDVCSAIHPMAAASPYLRTLPLAEHGLEWVEPPAAVAHPMREEPAALLFRSVAETARGLGEDAAAYERTFAPLVAQWPALFGAGMGRPAWPSHPAVLARFGALAAWPATTLARRLFRTARAQALFAGIAAHSVLPLEQTPSAAIGLMLQIAGHAVGWPFPRGGARSLADAMVSLFVARGGTIRCGTRIDDVDACETLGPVFFDTGPHALARIAGRRLPEAYVRALGRYRYGPGAYKIDYALSAPIPWRDPAVMQAGTVHLGGTLAEQAESERAPHRGRVSDRPYVLVAQQSLFDDTRAPAGQHTGWAYCHVPPNATVNMTDAIERQIERYAPGFRDCILARVVTRPSEFAVHNPNYVGGDVNGGMADLWQLFARPVLRASPWSTPDSRVFLCSASTPPGGGVHGMCGYNAVAAAFPNELAPLPLDLGHQP